VAVFGEFDTSYVGCKL